MATDHKCIWGGCGRAARWQISILLWALATPAGMRTRKRAAKMISGVTVCDECRPNVKAADFLLPEGRERILTGMQRMGAAIPDFSSAEVEFDEIVDKPVSIEEMLGDARRRGNPIIEA